MPPLDFRAQHKYEEIDISSYFNEVFNGNTRLINELITNAYIIVMAARDEYTSSYGDCTCNDPSQCATPCSKTWIKSIFKPLQDDALTQEEYEQLKYMEQEQPVNVGTGVYITEIIPSICMLLYVSRNFQRFRVFSIRIANTVH